MGKPGKSFNTWVKVNFSSHESVTRVCPMDKGRALHHTDTLIRPAACGRCLKPDSSKDEARPRSRSLSCAPELSSCSSNSPSNARKVDLEAGPLDSRLETNHLKKSKTVPKP